jgi:hypothetical protein
VLAAPAAHASCATPRTQPALKLNPHWHCMPPSMRAFAPSCCQLVSLSARGMYSPDVTPSPSPSSTLPSRNMPLPTPFSPPQPLGSSLSVSWRSTWKMWRLRNFAHRIPPLPLLHHPQGPQNQPSPYPPPWRTSQTQSIQPPGVAPVPLVPVMGFENPLGSRVQVRVEFDSPILNPYPSPGFGGY